jgi:hypothetical protein
MIGALKTIAEDILQTWSTGDRVGMAFLTFKTLPPILSHSSIPPFLHSSRPPSLGLQTKLHHLGAVSLSGLAKHGGE